MLDRNVDQIPTRYREHLCQLLDLLTHFLPDRFDLSLIHLGLTFHHVLILFLDLLTFVVALLVLSLFLYKGIIRFRRVVVHVLLCAGFLLDETVKQLDPIHKFFIQVFVLIVLSLQILHLILQGQHLFIII